MKRIAEVDEASRLYTAGRVHCPAALLRITSKHSNRISIQARKAHNRRPAVVATDFKERIAIEYEIQEPPDVISATAIARNDREQLFFTALRIIKMLGVFNSWRNLPDVRRQ